MEIVSKLSNKGFTIRDETGDLIEVSYKSYFSSIAKTTFEGTEIEIKPKNVWNSKFDIIKNNVDCGDIHFNWKGHIIIQFYDETMLEKKWLITPKGFTSRWFEVTDEQDELYIKISSKINWKSLKYNYDVEQQSMDISASDFLELLIYCAYGINLYMLQSSGG